MAVYKHLKCINIHYLFIATESGSIKRPELLTEVYLPTGITS